MTVTSVRTTRETRSLPVVEDIPVIEMIAPMPGFPDHQRFALVQLDDAGVLCSLQSVEDPSLRFLVVPPAVFFPDYSPVIDDATVAALGIASAADAMVLLVVNPGDETGDATANLLAPVVVNLATRQGGQVVLDEDLPIRAPLLAA
ncbi:MAG: Flagellar assembly factor FliW [uncultured Nocardioidaceae bacterium]|uniref:Flagellar assembly factor FliW n=1 Tax=uncultured Nocardioidaceae bacterium TaxID=253824 RepID=A0A6J4KY90_9ACTN|nr:MAG: Flagellar assembly factor FliW [uncultured Nocardioidaceae bacterium]